MNSELKTMAPNPSSIRDLRLRHCKMIHGCDSEFAEANLRSREKQKYLVLVLNDFKLTLESSNQSVSAVAGDMLTFATAGSFNVESGIRSRSFFSDDSKGLACRNSLSASPEAAGQTSSNTDCLVIILESENLRSSFSRSERMDILHLNSEHPTNRQINVDQFRLLQRKFQMPTSDDSVVKASIDRHLELLLIESFSEFFTVSNSAMGALNSPVERIRHVVNKVIKDPGHSWTLDSMAEQANLSRSVFADRFREVAETTPYVFIRQERIKKAKLMLQASDSSVERIAEHCGYTSVSAFSKAFRNVAGLSPGLFRKSLDRQIAKI